MIVVLTLVSVLAVLLFLLAVAYFVLQITRQLESIGGANSWLSKIMYGLRAIEVETGRIGPQVTTLNTSLSTAGTALSAIDQTLARIANAAVHQGEAP